MYAAPENEESEAGGRGLCPKGAEEARGPMVATGGGGPANFRGLLSPSRRAGSRPLALGRRS